MVGELVWLQRVISELPIPTTGPFQVFFESQSALYIARNLVFHERTKHIKIDCHFVRNKLQEGLIALDHVGTNHQLVDILTKAFNSASSRVPLQDE